MNIINVAIKSQNPHWDFIQILLYPPWTIISEVNLIRVPSVADITIVWGLHLDIS